MASLFLGAGCAGPPEGQKPPAGRARGALVYPFTRKTSVVDDYHGELVADPYRWLEDDHAPETLAWVQAQNALTFGYLESIPARAPILRRLTELWNYERYGVPVHRGDRYFYNKNNGLQNQSILYTQLGLEGEPRVLLDPNTLSADGTVALTGIEVTDDGRRLAYGLATAGSDWQELHVRDVDEGIDLPDVVRWVKFSDASWTQDGLGFFYSRYDEPPEGEAFRGVNYYHKLYYHRLGTTQSEDRLIYERPDQKEWGFGGRVTDDGRYLVIHVWQGTDVRNRVFYLDLDRDGAAVVELLNDFDAAYEFVGNEGDRFYFRTDLHAPRGRVIAVDLSRPEREAWVEIVPESEHRLQGATLLNHQITAHYLRHASSAVLQFDLAGQPLREIELPALGRVTGFVGRTQDTETFYAFTSFTVPGVIYRYDLVSGQSTEFRRPEVKFDPDQYETHQVFCRSKDGTRVPVFVVHRKGLTLDGTNPTYLYGYGGFDISLTPSFSVPNLVWMEMGGVYAQANLRGGGEYGEDWHQAGMRENKQNVFDDFIAAAEWLIGNRYTRSSKLAIGGGSNGGLLVGACMIQRPGLFGAALPAVGVMDMLRFHKFTIGWAWTSEYGSADDPDQFPVLRAYSPLHNLVPGTAYPATLITTADHDDRVVPGHSFKFAAALQEAHAGQAPVLIRIETRAGHGAGKPMNKVIEEAADRWAFLVDVLQINLPGSFPRVSGEAED